MLRMSGGCQWDANIYQLILVFMLESKTHILYITCGVPWPVKTLYRLGSKWHVGFLNRCHRADHQRTSKPHVTQACISDRVWCKGYNGADPWIMILGTFTSSLQCARNVQYMNNRLPVRVGLHISWVVLAGWLSLFSAAQFCMWHEMYMQVL